MEEVQTSDVTVTTPSLRMFVVDYTTTTDGALHLFGVDSDGRNTHVACRQYHTSFFVELHSEWFTSSAESDVCSGVVQYLKDMCDGDVVKRAELRWMEKGIGFRNHEKYPFLEVWCASPLGLKRLATAVREVNVSRSRYHKILPWGTFEPGMVPYMWVYGDDEPFHQLKRSYNVECFSWVVVSGAREVSTHDNSPGTLDTTENLPRSNSGSGGGGGGVVIKAKNNTMESAAMKRLGAMARTEFGDEHFTRPNNRNEGHAHQRNTTRGYRRRQGWERPQGFYDVSYACDGIHCVTPIPEDEDTEFPVEHIRYVVWDIETTSLDPNTGVVYVIGAHLSDFSGRLLRRVVFYTLPDGVSEGDDVYFTPEDEMDKRCSDAGGVELELVRFSDEKSMVDGFMRFVYTNARFMIGFWSHDFDLPYIIQRHPRLVSHRIHGERSVYYSPMSKRLNEMPGMCSIDLVDVIQADYRDMNQYSLNATSRVVIDGADPRDPFQGGTGSNQKDDVGFAYIREAWEKADVRMISNVIRYCDKDVDITRRISDIKTVVQDAIIGAKAYGAPASILKLRKIEFAIGILTSTVFYQSDFVANADDLPKHRDHAAKRAAIESKPFAQPGGFTAKKDVGGGADQKQGVRKRGIDGVDGVKDEGLFSAKRRRKIRARISDAPVVPEDTWDDSQPLMDIMGQSRERSNSSFVRDENDALSRVASHSIDACEDDDGMQTMGTVAKGAKDTVKYRGAKVLDAKVGFYRKPVATLDFTSLYPSIIIMYGLDYTSVVLEREYMNLPGVEYHTYGGIVYAFSKGKKSRNILPTMCKKFLEKRAEYKKRMKSHPKGSHKHIMLDMQQKREKVNANSIYGFTGSATSKYPCVDIAFTVTHNGQGCIETARDCVLGMLGEDNVEVIYGDTDSVMVHFFNEEYINEIVEALGEDPRQSVRECFKTQKDADAATSGWDDSRWSDAVVVHAVMKALKPVQEEVTRRTRVDLKFEKCALAYLIVSKKAYAQNMMEGPTCAPEFTVSGMAPVKRDVPVFVAKETREVLRLLCQERDVDAAMEHVHRVCMSVIERRRPINDYALSQALKKEEYVAATPVSAIRDRLRAIDPEAAPRVGQRVCYAVCETPDGRPGATNIVENSYTTDEIERSMEKKTRKNGKLVICRTYYIDFFLRKCRQFMDIVDAVRFERVRSKITSILGRRVNGSRSLEEFFRKMPEDAQDLKHHKRSSSSLSSSSPSHSNIGNGLVQKKRPTQTQSTSPGSIVTFMDLVRSGQGAFHGGADKLLQTVAAVRASMANKASMERSLP